MLKLRKDIKYIDWFIGFSIRYFSHGIARYIINLRNGTLFETRGQASRRIRKMLPDHIKEHMRRFGVIK